MRSGLVLAGGRSPRFGDRDGALAEVDGTPAVRRIAERLDSIVDEVVVHCRAEQRSAVDAALAGLDCRLAVDPVPDEGPIAGMRTGFRVASGDRAAVVACDMPRTDAHLLDRLFESCGATAVPRSDGRLHPLHAVYDAAAARAACERTLAAGSRRLYDLLARVDPVVVDVEKARPETPLAEVAAPTDLTAVTDRLGG